MNIRHIIALALVFGIGCDGNLLTQDDDNSTSPNNSTAPNNSTEPNNSTTPNNTTPNNSTTPNNATPNNSTTNGSNNQTLPVEPPVDPGPCGATTFATALETKPVALQTSGELFSTPTAAGGAFVAWAAQGNIQIAHIDGNGSVLANHSVPGTQIYGLAANAAHVAVMSSRGSDVLALSILTYGGSVVYDDVIIGDVDHNVQGNEWFGPLIRVGRLTWTGDRWATYYAVQRLWPDGIAHYGDQLRLYTEDGATHTTQWGWGCSHSMEVRISHNGNGIGAVCASDCFPSKGVHFNHRGGMLYPDETGSNCAGGYGTRIGASIPMDDGFWAIYTATDNRGSHDVAATRITGNSIGDPVWLTEDTADDRAPNGGRLGENILVGWYSGSSFLAVLNGTTGATTHGPQAFAGASLNQASDFFAYPNGDTGWVQQDGANLELVRFRNCP